MVFTAPARLLLPVRVVEPSQPAAALSSASIRSGASEFSLLLHLRPHLCPHLRTTTRRRSFSVPAARENLLELQEDWSRPQHPQNSSFTHRADETGRGRRTYGTYKNRMHVRDGPFNSERVQPHHRDSSYHWETEEFENGSTELQPFARDNGMFRRFQTEIDSLPPFQQDSKMMRHNQNGRSMPRHNGAQYDTRLPFEQKNKMVEPYPHSLVPHQHGRRSNGVFVQPRFSRVGRGAAGNGKGSFRDRDYTESKILPLRDAQSRFHASNDRGRESGTQYTAPRMSTPQAQAPWNPQRRYGKLSQLASGESTVQTPSKDTWSYASGNHHKAPWEQTPLQQHPGSNAQGQVVKGEEPKGGGEQSVKVLNGHSAIARIIDKLKSIQENSSTLEQIEPTHVSHTQRAKALLLPGAEQYFADRTPGMFHQPMAESAEEGSNTKFPWEVEEKKQEEEDTEKERRVIPPTLAELTIPGYELKRLRTLSLHLKDRIKVEKMGVTENIASSIRQKFHTCEVVKIKCEGPPASNMKKIIQELERKTGGLAIWKAGSVVVLYRGREFGQPIAEIASSLLGKKLESFILEDEKKLQIASTEADGFNSEPRSFEDGQVGVEAELKALRQPPRKSKTSRFEPKDRAEYDAEVEDVLQEIGPSYEEWVGSRPAPVDADLLPAVSSYCPPFRLLPYGVKPSIGNTDATRLRRLSRPLSPHFVIGRNGALEGLAAAMVQLWEKSEIAKIGVKRGVLNSNQERMAEELKRLTGGTLLSRDKQCVTFYRGKDFLPKELADKLSERAMMDRVLEEEEERWRGDRSIVVQQGHGASDVQPSWVRLVDAKEQIRLKKEAEKARWAEMVNRVERKIAGALRKKERVQMELAKVEELIRPAGQPADMETLTEEELFMFRKLGIRMKAFLLVGRRGVFSGVVQNMHLHWKHRELVKLITKERDTVQLEEAVNMLVYESGGILVAVEPTSKGHAILVYRGKNYKRPEALRPANLLTKRLALKRSIDIQKRQALTKHIQSLEREIAYLRAGLGKLNEDRLSEARLDHETPSGVSNDVEGSEDVVHEVHHGGPNPISESGNPASSPDNDHTQKAIGLNKERLRRLCKLGPVFKADPLTKLEAHYLRKQALSLRRASSFNVGKSNSLSALAEAIRIYFLDHAFVKVGVKGRPLGTSIQDIVEELEDLTGGILYFQGIRRIVLYRGWPNGADMPTSRLYDVLSPEQCDYLEHEEGFLGDLLVDGDNIAGRPEDGYESADDSDTCHGNKDEEVIADDFIAGSFTDESDFSDEDVETDDEYTAESEDEDDEGDTVAGMLLDDSDFSGSDLSDQDTATEEGDVLYSEQHVAFGIEDTLTHDDRVAKSRQDIYAQHVEEGESDKDDSDGIGAFSKFLDDEAILYDGDVL